ncbi:hypothetical protein ABIE83_008436 [Bradyrhizobium diazoefficiens]
MVDEERRGQPLQRRLHEFGDFLLALDRGEQQQEFVARDARQHVGIAQVAPEPLRQLDQQRIADGVAVIVVDVLEIVDVEKGEREALAAAIAREQVVGAVLDHAPRRQAGQLVEIGRAEQLVLEILLLGDVGGGGDQELSSGEANGAMGREQHLARRAVVQGFLGDDRLAGAQRPAAGFPARRQIGRGTAAVHAELRRCGIVNQQKLAMGVLNGQAGRQHSNDFLEESEFGFARAGISVVVHRSHESCCFSAPLQWARSCVVPS